MAHARTARPQQPRAVAARAACLLCWQPEMHGLARTEGLQPGGATARRSSSDERVRRPPFLQSRGTAVARAPRARPAAAFAACLAPSPAAPSAPPRTPSGGQGGVNDPLRRHGHLHPRRSRRHDRLALLGGASSFRSVACPVGVRHVREGPPHEGRRVATRRKRGLCPLAREVVVGQPRRVLSRPPSLALWSGGVPGIEHVQLLVGRAVYVILQTRRPGR